VIFRKPTKMVEISLLPDFLQLFQSGKRIQTILILITNKVIQTHLHNIVKITPVAPRAVNTTKPRPDTPPSTLGTGKNMFKGIVV